MTDQIREDMERDEKVEKGILTREQADEESERWQQVCVCVYSPLFF